MCYYFFSLYGSISKFNVLMMVDRELSADEQEQARELGTLLSEFRPTDGVVDRWRWAPNLVEGYTVKGCFGILIELGDNQEISADIR